MSLRPTRSVSRSIARCFALGLLALIPFALGCAHLRPAADPLPSWSEGPARTALVEFVEADTDEGGPDFVPPAERIATFDNDGTLWVEFPLYTQAFFAYNRAMQIAPDHPEWKNEEPFKSLLAGNMLGVAAAGEEGLLKLVIATHTGMTSSEFSKDVSDWLATTRQPRFGRPYTELVYQPQLELLDYLRANGFKTYIASGGGVEFMRTFTEKAYGIPPEQVIGSSVATEFRIEDGKPEIYRLPKIGFIDDKAGKPVGIQTRIGRRPILAFGNSDGDIEMLEYATGSAGRRLGLFVHHTDAAREYAYDRLSHVGKLDKGLDLAPEKGWIVVDMKADWKKIFPFSEDPSETETEAASAATPVEPVEPAK
jgi:phosphoserine phosphatase